MPESRVLLRPTPSTESIGNVDSPGGFVGTKLFVVPRGTPTLYRGEWKPAGRKMVIELDKPGRSAHRYGDDWLCITWPGTGGYWRDVYQYRGEFVARTPSSEWA